MIAYLRAIGKSIAETCECLANTFRANVEGI